MRCMTMGPFKLCRRKKQCFMTILSLWLVLRVDSTNCVMEAHIETITSSFCRIDGDRYICTDVPKTIPPKITNVEVTGYIGHELPEGSFSDPSWKQVKRLYMSSEHLHYLGNRTFQGLNVSELVLEFPYMIYFEEGVFFPLDELENIELLAMKTKSFNTNTMLRALSIPHAIPKLKYFTFNPGMVVNPPIFTVTRDFITNMLQTRYIKVLNITNSIILLDNIIYAAGALYFYKVDTWNISGSTILQINDDTMSTMHRISDIWHFKTVDVSHSTPNFKLTEQNNCSICSYKNIDINPLIFTSQILLVENLYVNYLYKEDTIINEYLNFTDDNFFWKSLHFRGNNLVSIDSIWEFNKNNTFHFIDLSDNKIKFITPSFLTFLTHLETIILSRNQLFKMQHLSQAVELLKPLKELRYIDMSSNNLSFLPFHMFSTNKKLEVLKLGFNKFTTIMFDLSPLRNLVLLDLQSNEIHNVEGEDLFRLQTYVNWKRHVSERRLQLSLHSNPIVCTCRSSVFISWLADFSSLNKSLNSYSCLYGDQELTVDESTAEKSRFLCIRNKVIAGSVTGSLILLLVVISSVIWYVRRYKRMKQADVIYDFCRSFCENSLRQTNLVFMAYSSEENRINMNSLKQQFENTLIPILGTDEDRRKNIISTGDAFGPGRLIMDEISSYINDSCVFVAIMSNNFCRSPYCNLELLYASCHQKPIVPIVLEELDTSQMFKYTRDIFNRTARAKFTVLEDGTREFVPSLENICNSIIKLAAENESNN